MKTRQWVTIVAVIFTLAISTSLRAGPPAAREAASSTAVISMLHATVGDDAGSYSYVGSKKCKKCHIKQHKSWAKTRMANALDILKPGKSKEMKEKFHLDANKDYSTDPACLRCHTTGFGQQGGYAVPDPADKKSVRAAKKLAGVGCESCHGPGSEYVKVFDEILKSKRTYKVEELYAVGLRKIDASVCLTCHNDESPTVEKGDTFDYEKRKEDGTHEHLPLKQRGS